MFGDGLVESNDLHIIDLLRNSHASWERSTPKKNFIGALNIGKSLFLQTIDTKNIFWKRIKTTKLLWFYVVSFDNNCY
jgi:hypothetical protein